MVRNKKSQGLPLNTIILALIVIVVLVMIIVWFTGQFSQSTTRMDNSSEKMGECEMSNPAVQTGGYSDVTPCVKKGSIGSGCIMEGEGSPKCAKGWNEVVGVSVEGGVCCGKTN